jgi:uncharacterized protein (DUF488 family)
LDELPIIYTVGHSTRSLEEFTDLLTAAGVRDLVDVRSIPRSRRHPHFADEALGRTLPASGIGYSHEGALGGFRRPQPGSQNGGWRHPSFRGYADHMSSGEFQAALDRLEVRGTENAACVMCAETQWRRCHRRLIADALLIRGWRVLHLGLRATPAPHELTPFAMVGDDKTLTYPPLQAELQLAAGSS